jgi:cytochrome P450 family 130
VTRGEKSSGSGRDAARERSSGERESASSERITELVWDASDPQFRSDPGAYYRLLREESPVHRHAASGAYFLSRFDDVWAATADWQTYSSASPVAKLRHMASMDPPDHDRLRASVARFFAPSKIAALEPLIRAIARSLLDGLEPRVRAGERVDLVADFAAIFPSRVIHRLLGVAERFDEAIRAKALAIGAARDPEALATRMQTFVAETHRAEAVDPESATGILPALLRESGPDALAREDIGGVFSNLILAGTDTVTNLIGNGLVLLARHPAARAALAAEPAGIPAAVEEMLRFESPVQSLARRTTRAVALHGTSIPAGTEVRLLWGAANRDDREFGPTADQFDPTRSIRRHLALGHGIHFCLGAGLARLEARIAFEEILGRWPEHGIELPALERLPSMWVRAWERVPIGLERTGGLAGCR